MKILIEKDKIVNIYHDDYIAGNPVYDNSFIPITSYASDVDMKDVEQNQAWKFKIVEGELQYDQEKIAAKLNADVIRKRVARYQSEVDPLVLEGLRTGDNTLVLQANAKVEQIKKDLPKIGG